MKHLIALLASLLVFASALSGAPLAHDLGKGLVYFRIAENNRGLPDGTLNRSCVLDLRYTETSAVSPEDLAAWLQQHATPSTPVFVLANVSTAPALRRVLTQRAEHSQLLVIGPAAGSFHPDIAISVSADAEHAAYTALQNDTDIATLITPPVTKVRQDEAAIIAARRHGEPQDEEPQPELTDKDGGGNAPTIDLALQRAVHLHRAWLILGTKQR